MNKKGRPKEVVFRNDIVFELLTDCLNKLVSSRNPKEEKFSRVFARSDGDFKQIDGVNRSVSGLIRAGFSGYTSDILEDTGNLAFSRKSTHIEVMPYYFQASVPISDRVPIICIQQISGNGLYLFFKDFFEILKGRLESENLTINFNPIFLSGLYLQKYYKDGVVKGITATGYRVSSDLGGRARQFRIKSEIMLSPVKRKGVLATLRELMTRDGQRVANRDVVYKNVREIFELQSDMDDVEDLVIEVEVGSVRRKLSVGKDFGTAFDISNSVKRDADGYPDPIELDEYVTDFISESLRPYYED